MGFTIYESSGTFNPMDYGLTTGDIVQAVVVGGGAGGGVWYISNATKVTTQTTGNAGESSSFGSYVTALGGAYPTQGNGLGGSRGLGAGGWYPGVIASIATDAYTGDAYLSDTLGATWGCVSKYGGGKGGRGLAYGAGQSATSSGTAGNLRGIGAEGGASYVYNGVSGSLYASAGGGGAGYGAGGGGAEYTSRTSSSHSTGMDVDILGGNSGEVKEATIKLESTDPIAVTVGKGGTGAVCTKSATVQSGAGADGCVCIFW